MTTVLAPRLLSRTILGQPPDSREVLVVALALVFLGLASAAAVVIGMVTRAQSPAERMERRLEPYTVNPRSGRAARAATAPVTPSVLGDTAFARSAVELAGRMTRSRGVDATVDAILEAAGLPLRTAEWLLIQVGFAVGLSLLFLLLSGGSLLATVLGLVLGLLAPWMFLTIRRDRRETAFVTQLPDTLQLIAGSLQAGYSLPQALDTVVREGRPPMQTEFNRALVEMRLGRTAEDALDGIAARTGSQDFEWVVMAIRIQREVGGNLAELLTTVGDTIRERQRLRRQVKVLSAEGRLSAWILGAMPLLFSVYLVIAKPDYVRPLFSGIGLALVLLAAILLAVGAFWISRAVRVEV